ncbi:conserved hypothetical protein [Sulfurovum sp. NBC37-1]|nr:conserved hypothetical protein [Sulfurovum sp. NBC37-1]
MRRKMMKKTAVVLFFGSGLLFAALSPQVQNEKDLAVMTDFAKSHPKVMATLRVIDLEEKVIRFGAGCKVIFHRKESLKPKGMVGPADPLEFKRSTCLVD